MLLRDKLKFWIMLSNYVDMIVRGTSPLSLPDAIADSLSYVKAFGGTEQRNLPDGYIERQFIYMMDGSYIKVEDLPISAGYRVEFDFQTLTLSSPLRNYIGGRANGVSAGGGFRLSKLASGGSTLNRVVLYGFESGTEYYAPEQFQANTRYKYTYNNGVCTLESGGSVVSTRTFTVTDNTSTNWGINAYKGTVWATDSDGIYVYSLKVWNDQGELVMDLVPAVQRGTVPVVGFYDTVTGGFRTPTAGTFAAGGEAVPTPDAPMDIVSNNGKLVVRDTELPVAYKRLKDIVFDGEVYYATGTYLTGADTTTFTMNATEGARNVLGCYTGSSSGDNFSFYLAAAGSSSYVRYKNNLYRPVIDTDGLGQDYTLSITPTGTTGFDTNVTWTELEFTCPDKLYIGWLANATSPKFLGTFKGNITVSNRANFVPCERVSDGAIGYYDTYSETFFENQGTGTPTTSGYDNTHYIIYTDGTVETIEDTIGNTATAEMLLKVGDYTDVQEIISGGVTRKCKVLVCNGTEDWYATISDGWYLTGMYCLRISDLLGENANITTNRQSPYCTHFERSTNWISVGDRAGKIQTYAGAGHNMIGLGYGTVSDANLPLFKQWLADQYAAGTPVIVLYPLATPTTESVAGQTMQVQDGDNTLEITQASLNNLELEAEYKKQA